MNLDQALTKVAVLGAAGKMGSGIALLLLQEMAKRSQEKKGKQDAPQYKLNLIDSNADAFPQLRTYLCEQLFKHAEKNINELRQYFAENQDLVSNEEIIEAYVDKALNLVFFNTAATSARDAHLVFEAIIEDIETKAQVLHSIVGAGNKEGFFLSNTSSIPIQVLDEKAQLNHRLIGFHFYNPPAVQKLLEIIAPANTHPELIKIAPELAKLLRKTTVQSKDVAGFIGNGHMIREIAFACQKVKELSKEYALPVAIYIVNRVTQDWLVRPMGIFQLIDYVGIDVCKHISEVMFTYLKDPALKIELINQMAEQGILGGQKSDGTQKNGFFSYAKHTLTGIYSLPKKGYIPFAESIWIINADRQLGEMPKGHLSWKAMQKESHREKLIKNYLENLNSQHNLGSRLAQDFLKNSHTIANKLVQENVAASQDDVSAVLVNGFYHLYGV